MELHESSRNRETLQQSLYDQEEALDITSDPINIDQSLNGATHLTLNQRIQLRKVLIKNEEVFNGSLGLMAGGDYHINMKDDTPMSLQKRCFPVAKCYEKKFKKELERLEN